MILTEQSYREAAAFVGGRIPFDAETAVVLGSGLGMFSETLKNPVRLDYSEIPHAPVATNVTHKGQLIYGEAAGRKVIVLSGRVHAYEGYSLADTAFYIRLLYLMGIKQVILTNAAGGISPKFQVGDFLCISDHLYFFDDSPVKGSHLPLFGERFFDLSNAYDKRLRQIALSVMAEQKLPALEGVYAYMPGPQFETPAEIRALRILGADAVGMSTVAETIAAVQCGMNVLGISCISNPAAGISLKPLSDKDVNEVVSRRSGAFIELINGILLKL